MRVPSLVLMLCTAIWIGACGDQADTSDPNAADAPEAGTPEVGPPTRTPIALEGDGWDGGEGFDPTTPSDKVRVIQFLKPT